jgi:hypothetical protein
MFEALVLACFLSNPERCVEFRNTKVDPPLITYEQCRARAMEIANAINQEVPDLVARAWKCNKLPEGKFST